MHALRANAHSAATATRVLRVAKASSFPVMIRLDGTTTLRSATWWVNRRDLLGIRTRCYAIAVAATSSVSPRGTSLVRPPPDHLGEFLSVFALLVARERVSLQAQVRGLALQPQVALVASGIDLLPVQRGFDGALVLLQTNLAQPRRVDQDPTCGKQDELAGECGSVVRSGTIVPAGNRGTGHGDDADGRMAEHGLHPVQHQLRAAGPGRGSTHREDPRRSREPSLARLHLREAGRARSLPEPPRPPDQPPAPQARRQLRADRLGYRDPRGGRAPGRDSRHRGRREDPVLRRWGSGESPGWSLRGRNRSRIRRGLPLERPGAGEDGRVLGRAPNVWRAARARLREHRGRRVRGKEPVALARLRASADRVEGDRTGSGALHDRDRSAAHGDRRARGRTPAGATRLGRPLSLCTAGRADR